MEIEELRKLAESFFEWPTEDKTQVTLTSALLFAQQVLRMTQQQAEPVRWMYEDGSVGDIDCGHTCIPLYTAPQAQPAPIPTSERLPTRDDADDSDHVWWWCSSPGQWELRHYIDGFVQLYRRMYTHWLPTGLTRPPAPGGSDE